MIILFVLAFILGGPLIPGFAEKFPSLPWRLTIVLSVLFLLAFRAAYSLQSKIDSWPKFSVTPRVKVYAISPLSPQAQALEFTSGEAMGRASLWSQFFFVLLDIDNISESSPLGDAKNLRTYLTYYDESDNELFSLSGGWLQQAPFREGCAPLISGKPIELLRGDRRTVVLAVKYGNGDAGYGMSEESCSYSESKWSYAGWQKPDWKIGISGNVLVELAGDHVKERYYLHLAAGGIGQGMTPGLRPLPAGI